MRTVLLVQVFLVSFALALAVSWGNLGDPFVRHDDYPTVFGDAEEYYWKTISEGRWLNYWYIKLRLGLPTEVSFILYLSGWSLFAAAFSTHAMSPRVKVYPGARFLLAALIVLCPQSFDISQWFNTVAPGVWVMTIYAVLAIYIDRARAVKLLFVFVPLSFLAYNTYPFYLLALLLCRVDQTRSFRDLAVVGTLFVLAFAVAMLAANAINWYYHGVFGIEEADWRTPNPIGSFGQIIENIMKLVRFWQDLLRVYGMGNDYLGYLVLTLPLLMSLFFLRRDGMLALYALTPVAMGMGLLMVYQLKTGVNVPMRASVFFWLVSCFLMVFGIALAGRSKLWKIPLIGLTVGLIAFYSSEYVERFGYLQSWQVSTIEFAERIPPETERIVIFGRIEMMPGAREAGIQSHKGLGYRLHYLTGLPVSMCIVEEVDCSSETPPFNPRPGYESLLIETLDGVTYIRMPALDLPP